MILAEKYWKEIVENRTNSEKIQSIVGPTLIDLVIHYLRKEDSESARKHLEILYNEFEGRDSYKTAESNDLWGWLHKIENSRNE